jgi:hypothetical protein
MMKKGTWEFGTLHFNKQKWGGEAGLQLPNPRKALDEYGTVFNGAFYFEFRV